MYYRNFLFLIKNREIRVGSLGVSTSRALAQDLNCLFEDILYVYNQQYKKSSSRLILIFIRN